MSVCAEVRDRVANKNIVYIILSNISLEACVIISKVNNVYGGKMLGEIWA